MQVILESDEAWSLMTVVTSYAIDHAGLSQSGKQALRKWRTDRAEGTVRMTELSQHINAALGNYLDDATNRQVRTKGRYGRKKDAK